ncbi:relaxase/mobilization nuclease domain-containing protein [Kitasatospora sp. NPDC091335]|uniref:relaxase/mobilization nuclease domain-containing protein n=1 Tax=Kitasatospora sp. NPDC091335 TaxID=3364085 RepID=UPI003830FB8B
MIASWNGLAPDPAPERKRGPRDTIAKLAAQLDLPVNALGPENRPPTTVWHCSVRAAPEDRILSDTEWAAIAQRILRATGIAPEGDTKACRWVAVRHNADHIHIVATLVRQDGRTPKNGRDFTRAQCEARKIEVDYGLRRVRPGDGTAAKRPTQAEQHRAKRLGHPTTAREQLRTKVRLAVAASSSEEQFFLALEEFGVLVKPRRLPSGDIGGYSVTLPGETAWFSGSTLASDLSLPKIRQRFASIEPGAGTGDQAAAWQRAARTTEAVPHTLRASDDQVGQAHIAALGELLDITAALSPLPYRPQLRAATEVFERANRSRIKPHHRKASTLHRVTRELLYTGGTKDGEVLALVLFVIAAAVIAAAEWHAQRGHQQQAEAAWQASTHLAAAYQQAAAQPLADLAHRTPDTRALTRCQHTVRTVLPNHAESITADPVWPALATVLADAEQAGHDIGEALDQAAQPHDLAGANSPAQKLLWSVRARSRETATGQRTTAARTKPTRARASATPAVAPALVTGPATNDPTRRR